MENMTNCTNCGKVIFNGQALIGIWKNKNAVWCYCEECSELIEKNFTMHKQEVERGVEMTFCNSCGKRIPLEESVSHSIDEAGIGWDNCYECEEYFSSHGDDQFINPKRLEMEKLIKELGEDKVVTIDVFEYNSSRRRV